MDKIHEYEQISQETLPDGFRITQEDSICENGMPAPVQAHYESLADLGDEELAQRAEAGSLFSVAS